MKAKLTIKAIATTPCAAWLIAGCGTPQVWYQPGKTPAQACQSFSQAKLKAMQTVDPYGLGRSVTPA